MQFRRENNKHNEISLIPLINVIFLLLIFFMVAGTVEGLDIFEVDPPKSTSGQDKPTVKATIYLGADGKMAVNNDLVSKKDLKTIISTLFIDNPKQEVTIKSDAEVSARKLVWVMHLVEENGGEDIALVTQTAE